MKSQNLRELKLVRDFIPVLITCRFDEIPIKMKALSCPQHVLHYMYIGKKFQHSRASNSEVNGRIW